MSGPRPVGTLEAVWIKRAHRGPMDAANHARLVENRGLDGNVRQSRHRQVTIIEAEQWDQLMTATGGSLDPSARRANLMVRGIPLAGSRNRIIRVGSAQIRILGETKPCERMDQALPGLKDAMYPEWRGGAFGEVVQEGEVTVGDEVAWVED